ncbi:hypothetical protein ORI89_11255 [Sphingobacterium sp. UT-1RO-CII-1]|uniref:hypothetical protein n=1 Tax=Sphingobacterium sp. UT-1RO-CII-1 TaxID=2995225 RepID=UPI00227C32DB|nr:hypothetical protein [Sphingobacterium sp. UT-1RO-CII-1]MCY4780231.1 hypothetical protein [Sphingobacterium sp. UT-1RO-CII-1]
MKLLIKVNEIAIGPFLYTAYIFSHKEEDKIGFGIFLDGFKNPMIMFEAVDDIQVKINVSENQVRYIGEQSQSDSNQRQAYYKDFMNFVKSSELLAAKQIFPYKKMEYLADYRHLARIRELYLLGK